MLNSNPAITSISIGLDADCREAIAHSLSDLSTLVAECGPEHFTEAVSSLVMQGVQLGDLIAGEPADLAAPGASILYGFEVKPGNGYLKLFSALAGNRDDRVVRIRHGWPILSLVGDTPAIADGGAPLNGPVGTPSSPTGAA